VKKHGMSLVIIFDGEDRELYNIEEGDVVDIDDIVVHKRKKKMKVEKIIHKVFVELEEMRVRGLNFRQIVGKWQYVYTSKRGKISLIELKSYYREGKDFWEIWCVEGELFDGAERFESKLIAEERIKELLE